MVFLLLGLGLDFTVVLLRKMALYMVIYQAMGQVFGATFSKEENGYALPPPLII
jgi:hypothetical protein